MLVGSAYPPSMRRLINELTKLPSIGEKSAVRLAYYLVTGNEAYSSSLADVIREARVRTRLCEICHSLTEDPICSLCSDNSRSKNLICVVEKPADVLALERSRGFRGLYHVLHGLWSPLRGISPEHTQIPQLLIRIRKGEEGNDPFYPQITELVIATATTVEGDATARYIASNLDSSRISITRIAQGLPKGGELEYADEITLGHAISGRRPI